MRKSDNLPLRRQRHIDSPYPWTSLSIRLLLVRIPLTVFRVHRATSVELQPTRTLLDNGDGRRGQATNVIICGKLCFKSDAVLSNGNRLCPSQSDLCGLVGDSD